MVLAALARVLLCYNGSGDTGAMSLCRLPATHVSTCDWPATVHPRIGALVSRQALVAPWDQRVDCTASRGPTNRQYGPVRPCPAVSVRFLHFPPHSASSLMLSARACFPRFATRPVFSFVLWRATCNVLDLPDTPFLPSTRFHYAFSRPARPLCRPSCAGPLSL